MIYFSETTCDSPVTIDNADAAGKKHNYGDMVLYTCKGDMCFAYGRTSKTIRCMENRKWNETDLSCEGNVTIPYIESIYWHVDIMHNIMVSSGQWWWSLFTTIVCNINHQPLFMLHSVMPLAQCVSAFCKLHFAR